MMISYPLSSLWALPVKAPRKLLFEANGTKAELEMESARRVQALLFSTTPPCVAGLEIGVVYRPASRVGGDYYDFLEKPGRPLTFSVGDVSGKGMAAAMLMTMTRTIMRAYADSSPLPMPAAVLSNANAQLYGDFTAVNAIATAFIGQYDPFHRTLVYANAGHSPVVYRPVGGNARLLEADGTALGVMQTTFSTNQWLNLHPGDLLVIGTDGLVESRNPKGQWFGYDRLLDTIDTLANRPAGEIANELCARIDAFSHSEMREDDQTVVVLKCTEA